MTRTEIPRSPRKSAERSQPFRRSGTAHPVTLDQTPGGKFHCLGAHLSVAGGMHHAIEQALRLRCATVQVFVKNQRQWRAAPLRSDDLQRWHELLATPEFGPTVAHAAYLINLAATSTELYEQSQAAFAEELLRCDALGIPYLVIHPGAAGAQPIQLAIEKIAAALDSIFHKYPHVRAMPLLETTAGQGSALGRTFVELAQIIRQLREPQRVGVCVDTCHVFAAGYDIRTPHGYSALVAEIEGTVGVHCIRAWHVNDSRGDCGSRVDRHEHVGRGRIGVAGFRHVLGDGRWRGLPMIIETPKGETSNGRNWDAINLLTLRRLAQAAT